MHPSFASKYKPDLSLFTTLLRQLHHNRASRPKAVSQTENCTSFFLWLTHQTPPEFNSLHFFPSFPKVKLDYAGHTQNDFKPDSGPSFPQTQQSGALASVRGLLANDCLSKYSSMWGVGTIVMLLPVESQPPRSRILNTKHVRYVGFHTRLQRRSRDSQ